MAGDPRKANFLPMTAEGVAELFEHLRVRHGIHPLDARERLHKIKQKCGFHGQNVALDWTGNVYSPVGYLNPETREWLGSLTAGGQKRRWDDEQGI